MLDATRTAAARVARIIALSLVPLITAAAQNADSLTTLRAQEVLVRVRRYTSNDVAMARMIADSLVKALPADASALPDALFAKASIAPSAADAERDYGRIVNEFRFADRVPDALMRLALLESSRNNRVGALRHLDRLLLDHGDAPVRARASLLAGRLRMDANDPARACELLAAAYASAGPTERDVRDQAETVGAKCPTPVSILAQRTPTPMGVERAPRESASAAPTLAAAVPLSAAARKRQRDSVLAMQAAVRKRQSDSALAVQTAIAKSQRDSVLAVQAAARRTAELAAAARRDSIRRAVASAPTPEPRTEPKAPPVVIRRDSVAPAVPKPAVVTVRRDTTPTPARTAPPVLRVDTSSPRTVAATNFAVQFAAYNDRPGAERLASVLQQRGIIARVEGTAAPFRVRAGRYTTRAEAEAAAALWRRPGQAAMVVSYGPTP